jgi:glycosyltransferase involved in cell wall biosynthesis
MRLALFYPPIEGPPSHCRHLADALVRRGVQVTCLCRPGPGKVREPSVVMRYPRAQGPLLLPDLVELDRLLRTEGPNLDAVVMFGSFYPVNAGAALLARRHRVPYVVSPEGIVSPLAFTNRRMLLKQAYWRGVERSILSHAMAVRVVSDFERTCLQALGIQTPMFLAAEGPEPEALAAYGSFVRHRTEARRFLFLGRLDIWQKALDHMILGFAAALRQSNRGQQLVLVGPPLNGSTSRLRRLCASEGLVEGRDVVLSPPVYGTAKWEMLQSADVFLHPSRREGIPRSITEALAMGLPAIVSPETNLGTVVERARAGWLVPGTPAGVAAGVLAAMDAPDLESRAANAARLARTELSWDAIAREFHEGLVTALASKAPPE